MSQGYCASRGIIYDERAKPVLSVFLKFLIKKKSSCFFTNGCGCCCHAGGAFLFTIGKKAMYNWKNKK